MTCLMLVSLQTTLTSLHVVLLQAWHSLYSVLSMTLKAVFSGGPEACGALHQRHWRL